MYKNLTRLPLLALAALPLTLGAVLAATPQNTQPQNTQLQPPTQTQRQPVGTDYRQDFLQKLAAQLGVSADKLKAAATAAGSATIDQGAKAGDIPADRAQQMKQNLQQDPFALMRGGHGGPHGEGGPRSEGRPGAAGNRPQGQGQPGNGPERGPGAPGERGQFGRGGLHPQTSAAVAKALGLSESQLREQLQNGQSIASLARSKGVSTAQLHSAAVNALKTALQAEVVAGRLSQTQATQMLQRAQADARFGLH